MCCAAFPLTERRECAPEVSLRRCPIERHPIARPFLERRAEGRDRLGWMCRAALPLTQPEECGAEVVLRRRPVEPRLIGASIA